MSLLPRELPLHCLIESARGARGRLRDRVCAGGPGIALGEVDLCSQTGALEEGLDWPRGRIVNAAVAAGLPRPPQSVYPNVRDLEGLAASCRRGRELGHLGRAAIHPDQLPVIVSATSLRPPSSRWPGRRSSVSSTRSPHRRSTTARSSTRPCWVPRGRSWTSGRPTALADGACAVTSTASSLERTVPPSPRSWRAARARALPAKTHRGAHRPTSSRTTPTAAPASARARPRGRAAGCRNSSAASGAVRSWWPSHVHTEDASCARSSNPPRRVSFRCGRRIPSSGRCRSNTWWTSRLPRRSPRRGS